MIIIIKIIHRKKNKSKIYRDLNSNYNFFNSIRCQNEL